MCRRTLKSRNTVQIRQTEQTVFLLQQVCRRYRGTGGRSRSVETSSTEIPTTSRTRPLESCPREALSREYMNYPGDYSRGGTPALMRQIVWVGSGYDCRLYGRLRDLVQPNVFFVQGHGCQGVHGPVDRQKRQRRRARAEIILAITIKALLFTSGDNPEKNCRSVLSGILP